MDINKATPKAKPTRVPSQMPTATHHRTKRLGGDEASTPANARAIGSVGGSENALAIVEASVRAALL